MPFMCASAAQRYRASSVVEWGEARLRVVFVTTSNFSGHAIEYVRGLQQRVILIDGARLAELLVEFDVGVRVSRTVHVKRLDEDFFDDDA